MRRTSLAAAVAAVVLAPAAAQAASSSCTTSTSPLNQCTTKPPVAASAQHTITLQVARLSSTATGACTYQLYDTKTNRTIKSGSAVNVDATVGSLSSTYAARVSATKPTACKATVRN